MAHSVLQNAITFSSPKCLISIRPNQNYYANQNILYTIIYYYGSSLVYMFVCVFSFLMEMTLGLSTHLGVAFWKCTLPDWWLAGWVWTLISMTSGSMIVSNVCQPYHSSDTSNKIMCRQLVCYAHAIFMYLKLLVVLKETALHLKY